MFSVDRISHIASHCSLWMKVPIESVSSKSMNQKQGVCEVGSVGDGISRNADTDQVMLRRMELLEQRILSPPIRKWPIEETGSGDKKETPGLDQIVYIHQNSGSQHSFSFDKCAKDIGSSNQTQSNSLQQANQMVDDHLRVISQKLVNPTRVSTADAVAQDPLFGSHDTNSHEKVHSILDSNNRPMSSNSLPSSVSATIMSCSSNQTLVTAHLDRRRSIMSHFHNSNLAAFNAADVVVLDSPSVTSTSLLDNSKKTIGTNALPLHTRSGPADPELAVNVSMLTNKRKSFTPNKRVLTSIIDPCAHDGKKKCISVDESRSKSPNVGGPDVTVNDHPTSNKRAVANDVNCPIAINENAASNAINEHVSLSRGSLSNPPLATSSNAIKKNAVKAPPAVSNNAVITSFFAKASDKNVAKGSDKPPCTNTIDMNDQIKSSSNRITPISNEKASFENDTSLLSALERENASLKTHISSLEASLQDKVDQLNAVSNNQTIFHAHLRAQVLQCEKTITSLQDELKLRNIQTTDVIERLIRKQCTREQVELRQQLASDGARLGRLVFNRVGMHSVESWEDGLVSKNLKRKKDELKRKKGILSKHKVEQATDKETSSLEVSEIEIRHESIEMQIEEIQRQEASIEKEEESLYLEKAAHIKDLKRLTSEDASRFSSRPKVSPSVFKIISSGAHYYIKITDFCAFMVLKAA